MKDAVIYARVSTKDQEREGYSIPAQLELLREFAEREGYRVLQEFTDTESASEPGRTQFSRMLKFLNKRSVTVLVEKIDRLYRNFQDALRAGRNWRGGALCQAGNFPGAGFQVFR